jgi:hypothetical protein
MKRTALVMFAAASILATDVARAASADDQKWIAECMRDNAGAGVGTPIVRAYCACMTEAMSDNETRSVSGGSSRTRARQPPATSNRVGSRHRPSGPLLG